MPAPTPHTAQSSQQNRNNSSSNQRRPSGNNNNSKSGPNPPNTNANPTPKNVKRKSSKPIIDWLQRKLAGTVRARRISTPTLPNATVLGAANTNTHPITNANGAMSLKSAKTGASSAHGNGYADENGFVRGRTSLNRPLSNEMSLRSGADSVMDNDNEDDEDDDLDRRSSGAAVSSWSRRRSNRMDAEADEDASIRPFPPTSPPSPSPSRSSSSYLSGPRTFKSMSVSTKPTTVLSIDLTSNGMAHIAQAPPTPTASNAPPSPLQYNNRFSPHTRSSSGGGNSTNAQITFSPLPPFQISASRPSSLSPLRPSGLQAPQHTAHHPRNNPRPSSPPLDNASVLTLASSAFAMPTSALSRSGGAYAWTSAAEVDSVSHLSQLGGADSFSHGSMGLGAEDGALDRDASLRALRPRSSRRGSWESEASRWSAAVSGTGTGTGALGALGRGGSVRTAPSFRTGGGQTMEDQDGCSLIDEDEDRAGEDRDGSGSRTGEDAEGRGNEGGSSSPVHGSDTTDSRDEAQDHSPVSALSEPDHGRFPSHIQSSERPESPLSPPGTASPTSSSGEEPTRPTTPEDRKIGTESTGQDTTPKKEERKTLDGVDVSVGLGSPIKLEKE